MRVLIIGADGAIGRHMAARFSECGHEVIETTRRQQTLGDSRIYVDLADRDFSADALPSADTVLICAAIARFVDCRQQPDLARWINVQVPALVGKRYCSQGVSVILLSTSAVFNGFSPCVLAEHPMTPRSAYGKMKAEAETTLLHYGNTASILRLTKVVTPDMALLLSWIDLLKQEKPVRAYHDMTISPIALGDVEAAILSMMNDGAGGRYQVSAADDLNYAAIARHLAARLGKPESLVEATNASTGGIPENEIMPFTSLHSGRLQSASDWRPPQGLDVIERVLGPLLSR